MKPPLCRGMGNLTMAGQNPLKHKKRLVVLASGTGTLFEALTRAFNPSTKPPCAFEVVGLVSDKSHAPVITKAKKHGICVQKICPQNYRSFSEWDRALCVCLKSFRPDVVVLAGFLKKIGPQVLCAFPRRVINTHPSLLPRYGGKGMYGLHIHRAVLKAREKCTGVSIHLATQDYDTGPVLAQTKIPVLKNDSPQSLQARVKKIEQAFYVEVIKKHFSV